MGWNKSPNEDGTVWVSEMETARVGNSPINLYQAVYRAGAYIKVTQPRFVRSVLVDKSVANMIDIFIEKGGYGDLTLTDYLKKMAGLDGNK